MKPKSLLILLLLLSFSGCTSQPKEEVISSGHWVDYVFDPNSILSNIQSGKLDNFHMIESDLSITPDSSLSDGLTIGEYLFIANDFFREEVSEDPSVFRIHQVVLYRNCSEKPGTYHEFNIGFFHEYVENGITERKEYQVQIIRDKHMVDLVQSTYSDLTENWEEIDPTKVKISLDDVETIFSSNGGDAINNSTENHCYIQYYLANSAYWMVTTILNDEYNLQLWVDASDGSILKKKIGSN